MMENRNIPAISQWTFLKNARRILKNPLPFHHKNFERLGDTFQLKLGFGNSVVFSRDAGFLKYALQKNQKNYTKSPIQTKDLAKYVGQGLLTAEGAHWQKQRKLIQPAFHKKQLALLLDKIKQAIETEVAKIEMNTPFDIFPVCNDLAFQTVAKSLFHSAVDAAQVARLQYITEEAQKMLVRELRQPYLAWYFKWGGPIKKHLRLTQEAREILQSFVTDRKESGLRQDDLLDMLLDARYEDGTAMDNEQLIDEILILFTAGHETTSNALTFAFQLLATNEDAQQKVLDEIASFDANSTLMEQLRCSPYTQSVIEETMRLYPPAYFIDRVNKEEDTYNGLCIPKGSNLLFSLYEIHKHPNHWTDPAIFAPERFIENDRITYSSYYFPFGAGPRMCIGNNFAMYEMILAVQSVVKKFILERKTTPIEILPLITLKPKNAIITFRLRNPSA